MTPRSPDDPIKAADPLTRNRFPIQPVAVHRGRVQLR